MSFGSFLSDNVMNRYEAYQTVNGVHNIILFSLKMRDNSSTLKRIKEKIPPTRKHFSEYLKRSSINSFFFQPIEAQEISKIITKMDPNQPNS